MKRLTMCLTIGLIFLGMISVGTAQSDPSQKKAPIGKLSDAVCSAIQQYIAGVEAAGSMKDAAGRKAQYAAAEKQLTEVLKRGNKMTLLPEITWYAHYSEMAVVAGATDPKLTEIISNQLKTRTKLLEWCTSDGNGR